MLTIVEATNALKARTFHLDCVEMELVQNKGTLPERYTGSGFISQDQEGVLQFKLYAQTVENSSAVDRFREVMANRAGSIFGQHEHFTLRATDYSGIIWTANMLLPDATWSPLSASLGQSLPCWTGTIRTLERGPYHFPTTVNHSVTLRFFDDVDLPVTTMSRMTTSSSSTRSEQMTRDHIEFEAAQCHFHIRNSEGVIIVGATSESGLPKNFEMRVVEALRFVGAHSFFWRVMTSQSGGRETWRLASEQRTWRPTALQRPLSADRPEHFVEFWRLFGKYLEYIIANTSTDDWNRCSVHVNHALEASANSADAWAVSICVAVDGLASMVAWEEDKTTAENRTELCKFVREKLDAMGLKKSMLADRALGVLSMLNIGRVQDRLAPLVERGQANIDHIKAWKKLRHPGAHGNVMEFSGMGSQEIEDFLVQIRKVSTLMHHLCFYLIGYEGPFTDYGVIGWPTSQYPTPKALASP